MLKSASLSADTLAHAFEQSTDCVKLVSLDGKVVWMNSNGLCSMEIDDRSEIYGRDWDQLWPTQSRRVILDSLDAASSGETVRFDAFCPTAKGSPRWWNVTVSNVQDINGAPAGFLAISRDITLMETQRQALLVAAEEMRHRLRNTYAMIGGLFVGFAKGNSSHEQFAKDMQQRLVSLSIAQSLFAANDAPSDLGVLLPALIEPFSSPSCSISTEGVVSTSVSQGQADAIALALGELAVNSTKYGALCFGGSIAVESALNDREVSVVWSERSHTPVAAQERAGGKGLSLIERIVRVRSGVLEINWQPHGLMVMLKFTIQAT